MSFTIENGILLRYRPGPGEHTITIPPECREIGMLAFRNASRLVKLTIPGTCRIIGKFAFAGCEKLNELIIEDGCEEIRYSAFAGCRALNSVKIPASVWAVEGLAFDGTPWLERLHRERMEKTSDDASQAMLMIGTALYEYLGCEEHVTVPDGCTFISENAFRWRNTRCSEWRGYSEDATDAGLQTVTLPESCRAIDNSAFARLEHLKGITFREGLTTIGENAFSECDSLTELQLPASLKSIQSAAFSRCSRLVRVDLPDNCTSIGSFAFSLCHMLSDLTLPANLEEMGEYAFTETALHTVRIPGSCKIVPHHAFCMCVKLRRVEIEEGCTAVEGFSFAGCRTLTSVRYAESCLIEPMAWFDCSALTSAQVSH